MIFIIFFFLLSFASPAFATTLSIIDYPSTVIVGETFPITFNVTSTDVGTTYHYKIVGDTATDISIFPSCASKYDDCLNLIILDKTNNIATASAKINIQNNINNLKIRIAQSDQHSKTYDSAYINIVSFDSPEPTATTVTPTIFINQLIISEIMANPEANQNEWIEIYNPSSQSISLKDICFYDASNHSRCFSDDELILPNSYYSHVFSSGFLNNDGDTINFLDTSIIYPKSPKNFTYSRQENNSWCFANSSQNTINSECTSVATTSETNYVPPLLTLQFLPDSINAGDDFNLVFSLNSADEYFLRLTYPFGSQYFPFSNYQDGYSWLTLPLSSSKKLPPGTYPLSFHLKKNGSSHLYDYQLGNLVVKKYITNDKKILGTSTYFCPSPLPSSLPQNYFPTSTLSQVLPDANFFSWPFLFAGSILFLSPLLFPKLYPV